MVAFQLNSIKIKIFKFKSAVLENDKEINTVRESLRDLNKTILVNDSEI